MMHTDRILAERDEMDFDNRVGAPDFPAESPSQTMGGEEPPRPTSEGPVELGIWRRPEIEFKTDIDPGDIVTGIIGGLI